MHPRSHKATLTESEINKAAALAHKDLGPGYTLAQVRSFIRTTSKESAVCRAIIKVLKGKAPHGEL